MNTTPRYTASGHHVRDTVTGDEAPLTSPEHAEAIAAALNVGAQDPMHFHWTPGPAPDPEEPLLPVVAPSSFAGPVAPFTRADQKKRGWFRRNWLPIVVGIVLVLIGYAFGVGGSNTPAPAAAPAPAETVEIEVPAPLDTTCQAVAMELKSMLQTAVNDIMIPQNEVTQTLIDSLIYGTDVAAIDAATETIGGVTSTTNSLTDRINAVEADYNACIG